MTHFDYVAMASTYASCFIGLCGVSITALAIILSISWTDVKASKSHPLYPPTEGAVCMVLLPYLIAALTLESALA